MLLAIDTSTSQIGICLYAESQVLAEMIWVTKQHHTTQLAASVSDLLSRCDVSMSMVSALGIAIGPGSFTSLRVGLSFVKGIAFAKNIPMIGISTLDVIAMAQPLSKHSLIAIIQAGRKRIAFREYQVVEKQWQAQGQVRSATVEELLAELENPIQLAGELTSEDRKKISKKKKIVLASPVACIRRPAVLAELAFARFQKNDVDDVATLAPIYLHVAGTPIS